jgi:transcriptional regulator with XRE-family HTH domain
MAAGYELVYSQYGIRIRAIREALGLDQATLAGRVGLTRTSLTNLEAGRQRVQLHQVEKMAKALGTTAKHLMRGIWW